jgi:simple sugar transport system permease protein
MSTATAPVGAAGLWDRVRTWSPSGTYLPVAVTLALFVGLFGAGSLRYEAFGDPQTFLNLFTDNAHLLVLGVGMTFVVLTGGIDLSVGAVVALSTMVAARTLELGWAAPVTMLVVLASSTLLGLLMGLMIHLFDVQPFIATLAGMFLARGLCYLISIPSIPIRDDTFVAVAQSSVTLPGGYYVAPSVVLALVVVAVAAYVLHTTRFGRTIYAIGGSESSAHLMGLRVGTVKVGAYVISGLCSGTAGLLFAFYTLSGNSLHGVGMELDAIAAVVIGGTLLTGGRGHVLGTLLGVLVTGTLLSLISFDGTLSSWWTRIVIGALLLVFVVVQRLLTRREG